MERRVRTLILGLVLVISVSFMAPFIVGAMLPVEHVTTRTVLINKHPRFVWEALAEVEQDLEDVRVLVVEEEPPTRRVIKVAGRNLGFGGTWETTLVREGLQTRVTITERGEVHNPVFRFLFEYAFGYDVAIVAALTDLGRHLGQDVEISEPGD